MRNLHSCHCLEGAGQVVLSSWFSIKLWYFNIQCLTKVQIKYLEHFITIKLLEKADFLGIASSNNFHHTVNLSSQPPVLNGQNQDGRNTNQNQMKNTQPLSFIQPYLKKRFLSQIFLF